MRYCRFSLLVNLLSSRSSNSIRGGSITRGIGSPPSLHGIIARGGGGGIPTTTTALSISSTVASLMSRNIPSNPNDDGNKNEIPDFLPSLVLLGDRHLMTPCPPYELPPTTVEDDDEMSNAMMQQEEMQQQLTMLKQCQKKYGGIGIAACQVGWRTRIFSMGIEAQDTAAQARYPTAPLFPFQFWINPTLSFVNETDTCWFWEGCLSVPGMRGWVERPKQVQLHGHRILDDNDNNKNGGLVLEETTVTLDGLASRVAQHEFDHLNGILFPQRAMAGTLVPVPAFDNQDNWLDECHLEHA